MSTLEDRLRDTLTEMADEVRPVPMLPRLQHTQTRRHAQRRIYRVAAIAAAIIAALVAGSLILLRAGEPGIIEPVDHPPKTIRLSSAETPAPGRTELLLVLANNRTITGNEKPAYALSVGSHRAVRVTESDDHIWTDHLSLDGTRLVREVTNRNDSGVAPAWGLEIVDLRTGAIDDLRGERATCPELSPDNRTVAAYRADDVALIDVATGVQQAVGLPVPDASDVYCAATFAWSPDARQIVLPDGADSVLLDRRTGHRSELIGVHVTNGSMSWSPDGRFLLLYEADHGGFVARNMREQTNTVLQGSGRSVRPLGWAGSRIVWLAGQVGHQRLITTDSTGRDHRLWTRLHTHGLPIQSVTWSSDLSGTAG